MRALGTEAVELGDEHRRALKTVSVSCRRYWRGTARTSTAERHDMRVMGALWVALLPGRRLAARGRSQPTPLRWDTENTRALLVDGLIPQVKIHVMQSSLPLPNPNDLAKMRRRDVCC